ncbi:hypothetical protein FSP39_001387 [Pinctada imbricata]|uniref:Uncharacterized protein n=1 Tax=Pinctada imbricata TaxID=66713 RepID=A0AA88XNC5_PINIB|nr:hypothetical protein FSP39_001387 [Pinctada imbricata]
MLVYVDCKIGKSPSRQHGCDMAETYTHETGKGRQHIKAQGRAPFDPDQVNANFGQGGFGTGSGTTAPTSGFNFNPDKLNQNFGSGGFGSGGFGSGSGTGSGSGSGSGSFGSGGFGGQQVTSPKFDPNSFTAGTFDPNKQYGFGGSGFDPNSFGRK